MAAQTMTEPARPTAPIGRTVLVIDRDVPKGLAANAAVILGLTLGVHRPDLIGDGFEDGSGVAHLGLFPGGLPVLGAAAEELGALRAAADERGLTVVDLPAPGQQTNDYDEFRSVVKATPAAELAYIGVLVSGPAKAVRAVTGQLGLLR